jgi:hypothetical protein
MGKYDTTPEQFMKEHGPKVKVAVFSNNGRHTVIADNGKGRTLKQVFGNLQDAHEAAKKFSPAERLEKEAGGSKQAVNVKKTTHPDQQGAESEERGYQQPDLVI